MWFGHPFDRDFAALRLGRHIDDGDGAAVLQGHISGLAIGRVSYDRWLAFIWPLLLILTIFISVVISIGAFL